LPAIAFIAVVEYILSSQSFRRISAMPQPVPAEYRECEYGPDDGVTGRKFLWMKDRATEARATL